MKLTVIILALVAMCASAFVTPTAKPRSLIAPSTRATTIVAPKATMTMGVESVVDLVPAVPAEAQNQALELVNNANLLALSADSFGGLIGPICGCLAVAAFIVILAPPRVE